MPQRPTLLAPLSRGEAERLLPSFASERLSLEDRVLRARCLRAVQAFDVAWNELFDLRERVRDRLVRARVEQELLHLAYYVTPHALDVGALHESALKHAAGDPLLTAEIDLAWSVHRLFAKDATGSLRSAQAALDALRAVGDGRHRDLVYARVERQLAHILAQTADYRDGLAAAESAIATARKLRDAWEIANGEYVRGFAEWSAGTIEEAEATLLRAEELLRPFGTSAWRWTVFCLARVKIEQGHIEEGDRLARQSASGQEVERAFVALSCRETDVAEQILQNADEGQRPFTEAVRGMIEVRRGELRTAVRRLEDARTSFAASGLHHYALGCAAHAAFARESLAYGGGRERAIRVVRELGDRGASGFAWFLPDIAEWLGKVTIADPRAASLAKVLRVRGETARERALRSAPAGASDVDGATAYLRMAGLTWRELDIVRRLSLLHQQGEELDRTTLAERLGMSPNTLRVHLTRIRAKLDVGEKRGDEAILEAVKRLPAAERERIS